MIKTKGGRTETEEGHEVMLQQKWQHLNVTLEERCLPKIISYILLNICLWPVLPYYLVHFNMLLLTSFPPPPKINSLHQRARGVLLSCSIQGGHVTHAFNRLRAFWSITSGSVVAATPLPPPPPIKLNNSVLLRHPWQILRLPEGHLYTGDIIFLINTRKLMSWSLHDRNVDNNDILVQR